MKSDASSLDPSRQRWTRRMQGIYNIPVIIVAALLVLNVSPVVSQQQNKCSCTPLEYKWTLNFTKTCNSDIAVGPNAGVEQIFCDLDVDTIDGNTNNNEVDGAPVIIDSYLLVEIDEGNVARYTNVTLIDGDTINFVSNTTSIPSYISTSFLGGITGRNAAGEKIELSFLIQLSNICEKPPFQDGNNIGWLSYSSGVPFRNETCFPSSNNPSATPSILPTSVPTASPTSAPSLLPSVGPSLLPSGGPSVLPSVGPTGSPTKCKKSKSNKSCKEPKSPKGSKSKDPKSPKTSKTKESKSPKESQSPIASKDKEPKSHKESRGPKASKTKESKSPKASKPKDTKSPKASKESKSSKASYSKDPKTSKESESKDSKSSGAVYKKSKKSDKGKTKRS